MHSDYILVPTAEESRVGYVKLDHPFTATRALDGE